MAAPKRAETAFDGASDRFTEAEQALEAARERRARAREDGYAARQAYERANVTAGRLQCRVSELADRLDRLVELSSPGHHGEFRGCPSDPGTPYQGNICPRPL